MRLDPVEGSSFSSQRLHRNLAALAVTAPEVACWLRGAGADRDPDPGACPPPQAEQRACLQEYDPPAGGITVILGGGDLELVWEFLQAAPAGHQVFLLEPRPECLASGLARFDLEPVLCREALVILAPSQAALEEALNRHPQLGLVPQVEFLELAPPQQRRRYGAVWARLYRLLGHALKARDLALKWEEPRGVNLISNLSQVPLMGRVGELAGCLQGATAVLLEAGPSLSPALERLAGNLGGVLLMASDEALPQVMEADILPSAVVCTIPGLGRLSCYSHQGLERVPLIAEDVAHAPTVRAHPGPRFICLGARGTALSPLDYLARHFTPQHHTLGRMAEMALFMGCRHLVLAGADLVNPGGDISLPAMDGRLVTSDLEKAAAACSLGQVLARGRVTALNTSPRGLGLPGTRLASWEQVQEMLPGPGQPLVVEPLLNERWLPPPDLEAFARDLRSAAAAANRLWQRAAAPLADYPPGSPEQVRPWLAAADALYVALAEQAAADRLQAAFLEGCLVRAFLRRYRLICQGHRQATGMDEACRGLGSCLKDLQWRAHELAQALAETAGEFIALAQALYRSEQGVPEEFARQIGRPAPAREAA